MDLAESEPFVSHCGLRVVLESINPKSSISLISGDGSPGSLKCFDPETPPNGLGLLDPGGVGSGPPATGG